MSAKQTTIENLQETIRTIDSLSQSGLSQIKAIANLALAAMQTRDGASDLESIGYALQAIADRAFDVENCIGCEAERVGCNHVDEASRSRLSFHELKRLEGGAA